jgi:hypothetical protein
MPTVDDPRLPARRRWLVAGGLALVMVVYARLYLPLLQAEDGAIGHDYGYFLPHLLAGDYWLHENGPGAVPWFSPAFCGGVPFYANPQSLFYSVPQALTALVNPFMAVLLTFLLFAGLGLAGFYRLLKGPFRASTEAAFLGAVLFLFNGLYSHRLLVGHLTFHAFMLLPWLAELLLRGEADEGRWAWLRSVTLGGLVLALMIQAGLGAVLLPVLAALVALLLVSGLRDGQWRSSFARLIGAGIVGGLLSAAKLSAAAALLSQFKRDYYLLPGFADAGALLTTAFRSVFVGGSESSGELLTHKVVTLGQHEWEYSVTPIPLVLMAWAFIATARSPRPKRSPLAWSALALVLVLPLALNWSSPGWSALLKQVPLVNASSNMVRWFLVYVPLLCVTGALALDRIPLAGRGRSWLSAVAVVAVIGWHAGADLRFHDDHPYKPRAIVEAWSAERESGRVPAVDTLTIARDAQGRKSIAIGGDDALAGGASQIGCYEPLFGYNLERLPMGRLHEGPALSATGDALNVKNPACYAFPAENHCAPGDEYTVSQLPDATAFLAYRPVHFREPPRQTIANVVNLLAIAWTLVVLVASAGMSLRRRSA